MSARLQAELLFADPTSHAPFDTAVSLDAYASSGSDHPSWLDAELDDDDDIPTDDIDRHNSTCGHVAAMCI